MPTGITVSARNAYSGPTAVIARYDTSPGRIWSISIPALPREGQASDGNGPAVIVSLTESGDGLPREEMAVVDSLGRIMAEPGAKRIRLNVVRADGQPSGILGNGRLALHVHLLETTSQLQYGGEPTTYTVAVTTSDRPGGPAVRELHVRQAEP